MEFNGTVHRPYPNGYNGDREGRIFFGMKKPMELYIGQKINQNYFKIL